MSVYFNIRNALPKSGTFLLGHPVYKITNGAAGSRLDTHDVHGHARLLLSLKSRSNVTANTGVNCTDT